MAEKRVPKSEIKKKTEKITQAPRVKITGSASTPPRVSSSMINSQPKTSTSSTSADKYVDPLYSRNAGFAPIYPMNSTPIPGPLRGAGDPDYSKKMKTGRTKPLPKK